MYRLAKLNIIEELATDKALSDLYFECDKLALDSNSIELRECLSKRLMLKLKKLNNIWVYLSFLTKYVNHFTSKDIQYIADRIVESSDAECCYGFLCLDLSNNFKEMEDIILNSDNAKLILAYGVDCFNADKDRIIARLTELNKSEFVNFYNEYLQIEYEHMMSNISDDE